MKKICILSVPRSGSSWVGQIFNSSPEVLYKFQPNFSYSFPFQIDNTSDSKDIEDFYEKLEETKDPFVNAEESISGKPVISFEKSNINKLVWKEVHSIYIAENLLEKSDTKVIGLIRSPMAVLASWIKIPKEFDQSWSIIDEWRFAQLKNLNSNENYFGYQKWKEVTELFLNLKNKYPERFYLLNYDTLLQDSFREVEKMFSFCEIEFKQASKEFLEESSSKNDKDAYSVFKSKKHDKQWQTILPKEIVDEIKSDDDFVKWNKIFGWEKI